MIDIPDIQLKLLLPVDGISAIDWAQPVIPGGKALPRRNFLVFQAWTSSSRYLSGAHLEKLTEKFGQLGHGGSIRFL
jgi:hypothetical protein